MWDRVRQCDKDNLLFHDHRARAFVGEDLGEYGVSLCAAYDMCGMNASPKQRDQIFKLGNHSSGCTARVDHVASIFCGDAGEFGFLFFRVEVNAVDVAEQDQLFGLEMNSHLGGDHVRIDIKYTAIVICPER